MFITTRVVVHPDEGVIERHMSNGSIRKGPGTLHSAGYRALWISNRRVYVHRLVWEYVHGDIPEGMEIDHINRVKDDNRICNLRLVTHKQNGENHLAPSTNTSGIKGVHWSEERCKWVAAIHHWGKIYQLGRFTNVEDAQAAYAGAAALLHTHNPHAAP